MLWYSLMVLVGSRKHYLPLQSVTRMHSSRMRTARAFTVCRSLLLGGCTWSWGVVPGGVPGLGVWSQGGVPSWSWRGIPGLGGVPVWSRGCTCLVLGGVVPGVLAWSGGCTWSREGCTWSGTPPRTEFLTHASEIITLPETSFAGGKNELYLLNVLVIDPSATHYFHV